jgi:hypothetical protein
MLSLNTTTWNPMRLEFLDMQEKDNPLNGALIDSKEELVRILEQLRHRQPFGLKLKGENGFTLDICLAREFGSLQHSASSETLPTSWRSRLAALQFYRPVWLALMP